MKSQKTWLALVLCFALAPAWAAAADLSRPKPVPENPLNQRPKPFPDVSCANIVAELERLKNMSSEHNQAVAGYMDETAAMIDRWHKELSPLEGNAKTIERGQFQPIKDGSNLVAEAQVLVWENMDVLNTRFDQLLEVLPNCLK